MKPTWQEIVSMKADYSHLEIRIAQGRAMDHINGIVRWHVRSLAQQLRFYRAKSLTGEK